jgi:hypothetical protein
MGTVKKSMDDMLSSPTGAEDPSMWFPVGWCSNRGAPICRFMQFEKKAQETLHKFGTTFDRVEATLSSIPLIASMSWETDEYMHMTTESWVYSHRIRHFMVAKHEIELENFKAWLPANSKMDIGFCVQAMGGDEEGFLCLELGMHEEGLRRTKQNLLRYPFNPSGVPTNYLALTQLLGAIGRTAEAAKSREMALQEAHRMALHMLEFMVLSESPPQEGEEQKLNTSIPSVISRLSGQPAAYEKLRGKAD